MKKQIFIIPLILFVLTAANTFGQEKDTSENQVTNIWQKLM